MTDAMLPFALAAAGAAAIVAYWIFCRRVSLRHREKAAALIEAYFADDSVPERDIESIYFTYRVAGHWVFLPLATLFAPLVMLVALVRGGAPMRRESERHSEIMDALVMMYMTRNPLTSLVCMQVIFVSLACLGIVGLLFDRIKAIPSPSMAISSMASTAAHTSLAHHAR